MISTRLPWELERESFFSCGNSVGMEILFPREAWINSELTNTAHLENAGSTNGLRI